MSKNTFNDHFKLKEFAAARDAFLELKQSEQINCLENLFQQAMHATTPSAISVLFRKLHPGKSSDDFRTADLPPKEFCNPEQINNEEFQNFFPVPTRVFNAVDMNDSSNIVSVGLTWTRNTEEEQAMQSFFKQIEHNGANKIRTDRIKEVADKDSSGIYITKTNDNFGTAF